MAYWLVTDVLQKVNIKSNYFYASNPIFAENEWVFKLIAQNSKAPSPSVFIFDTLWDHTGNGNDEEPDKRCNETKIDSKNKVLLVMFNNKLGAF